MLADSEKPDLEHIIRWLDSDDDSAWIYYSGIAEQMVVDLSEKTEPKHHRDKSSGRRGEAATYHRDHRQARAALPHVLALARALKHHLREPAKQSAKEALVCMNVSNTSN